jgi:translation initiation factor 6
MVQLAFSINLFDIYRSPNIGIFLKTNNSTSLVPRGLAPTKCSKISELLKTEIVQISIGGSRLIGPLVAMNSNGIIVSRLAEDEEVETLRNVTGLKVMKLGSRFTSVGNLICANDHGAVVSDVIGADYVHSIEQTLSVPVQQMRIDGYVQVGSLVAATNKGGIIYPDASESEIETVRKVLKIEPEPATLNGGVPFVSSGFVGNTSGVLLGSLTRGGELVIIGRAFPDNP